MANQTGRNLLVAYKVEATLNEAPTTGSAEVLPLNPGAGLNLNKEQIQSNRIRSDGLTVISRHGSRSIQGSYSGELSVDGFLTPLAAVARATITAASTITEADASLASITFGTNTVVATNTSTGSGFLDAGIRVGDVFRVSGTSGDNDNKHAQVRSVATHTIVVQASAFVADSSAATTFSLTRGQKVVNGTEPERKSFTVEEYLRDIDQTQRFGGVRFTSFSLSGTPNGMAEVEVGALGMSVTVLATSASPYFDSPTEHATDPLVFADAIISLGGEEIAVATSFNFTADLSAETLPVIGSDITPDVFDNQLRLSILRQDLDRLTSFADEDELELAILLKEPGTLPVPYFGLFVPRLKFMSLDAPLGADGAMIETLEWEAGVKTAESGYDQTMFTVIQNL